MTRRVGIGLLVVGLLAFVVGAIKTGGNVVGPDFNGWRLVFHLGVLATGLGIATIALAPDTTRGVIGTTLLGVFGQFLISLLITVSRGNPIDSIALLWSVLPFTPIAVGYLAGALHNVPGIASRRHRNISLVGVSIGLLVWFGALLLFTMTHDTTGESGFHSGFLLLIHSLLLFGEVFAGGLLYSLWRLREPTPQSPTR